MKNTHKAHLPWQQGPKYPLWLEVCGWRSSRASVCLNVWWWGYREGKGGEGSKEGGGGGRIAKGDIV